MESISTWWMWIGFVLFISCMLYIDLVVLKRGKSHRVSNKEALTWTCIWVSSALIFNLLLWVYLKAYYPAIANQRSLEFLTGDILEQSLSVDNLFVFIMVFKYFSVPEEYQHRTLLYGVIGAIVMRAIMIILGVWIVNKFEWVILLFGAFLVFTGIRMLIMGDQEIDFASNSVFRFIKKYVPITERCEQEKFFVIKNGIRYITPLFVVLIVIEFGDLIFALDSIPAIFGITRDPFIIFTSNIFAILGLRTMFFLLRNMASKFDYLKYGIAIVLTFIGIKMLLEEWIKIPVTLTLGFMAFMIVGSILVSWWRGRRAG